MGALRAGEDRGCPPGKALTGLCLAGCRSWKGCGEGGRRREGPGLRSLFITVHLLRDDFGVKQASGVPHLGMLLLGVLGPSLRKC